MKLDNLQTAEFLPLFCKDAPISKAICACLDALIGYNGTEQMDGFSKRVHALPCENTDDYTTFTTSELKETFDTVGVYYWYPEFLSLDYDALFKKTNKYASNAISGKQAETFSEVFYSTGKTSIYTKGQLDPQTLEPVGVYDPHQISSDVFKFELSLFGVPKGGNKEFNWLLSELKHTTRASCDVHKIHVYTESGKIGNQKGAKLLLSDVSQYVKPVNIQA